MKSIHIDWTKFGKALGSALIGITAAYLYDKGMYTLLVGLGFYGLWQTYD